MDSLLDLNPIFEKLKARADKAVTNLPKSKTAKVFFRDNNPQLTVSDIDNIMYSGPESLCGGCLSVKTELHELRNDIRAIRANTEKEQLHQPKRKMRVIVWKT